MAIDFLVTAPRLTTAPVLNGKPGDGKWTEAVSLSEFCPSDDAVEPSLLRQQARLSSDGERLYFAFSTSGQIVEELHPEPADNSNPLSTGESVELHWARAGAPESHWRLIVNSDVQVVVARGATAAYSRERLELHGARSADGWGVEWSIPWRDLPGNGTDEGEWQFLIVHNECVDGVVRTYCWSDSTVVFQDLAHYPGLRFVSDGLTGWPEPLAFDAERQPIVRWRVVNRTAAPQSAALELDFVRTGIVRDDFPVQCRRVELAPGESRVVEMTPQLALTSPVRGRLSLCDERGRALFRYTMPMAHVPPHPVNLTCRNWLPAGWVAVELSSRLNGEIPAVCEVFTPSGKCAGRGDLTIVRHHGALRIPVATSESGDYRLLVTVDLPGGEPVELSRELAFQTPPAWAGNKLGLDHRVSPPYLPVTCDGKRIGILAGTYELAGSVLPSAIAGHGTSLLTRPCELTIEYADGGRADFNRIAADPVVTEEEEDLIRLTFRGSDGVLDFRAELTAEEDGFLWYEWEWSASRPVTVTQLTLRIPLTESVARYVYPIDYTWVNYARTLSGDWRSPFRPAVTIYNDDCGLAWYAESQSGWENGEAEPLRLRFADGTAQFEVTFIDRPVEVGAQQPLRLAFGLQIAPPKPYDPCERRRQLAHQAIYDDDRDDKAAPGALVYKCRDGFPYDAGSLTLRICPEFTARRQTLWQLEDSAGVMAGLQWDSETRRYELLTFDAEHRAVPVAVNDAFADGWHDVTVTWSRDAVSLTVAERTVRGTSPWWRRPAKSDAVRLSVGDSSGESGSGFYLGLVRLSGADGELWRDVAGTPAPGRTVPPREEVGSVTALEHAGVPAWRLFGTWIDFRMKCGVTHSNCHQNWAKNYGEPYPADADRAARLHRLVEAYHQSGGKIGLYLGGGLGDHAPESRYYHDYWMSEPESRWVPDFSWKDPWIDFHDHAFSATCLGAGYWGDFIVWNTRRLLEEFDTDGFYYDGAMFSGDCRNESHGCGYRDRKGELHDSWPLRAMRLQGKRLYNILARHRRDGMIFNHYSGNVVPFAGAWSHRLLLGEEYMVYKPGFEVDLADFRAKFYGRQFGAPVEFLAYENQPFGFREGLAYSLIHDVNYAAFSRKSVAAVAPVRRILSEMEIERADWYPYWDAKGMVRVVESAAERICASLYVIPHRKALAVVANLTASDARVKVKLKPDAMGLTGARCEELEWGTPVVLDAEGCFELEVPARDVRLVGVFAEEKPASAC